MMPEWASFRGPSGMGIADSDALPIEWDDESIAWKTRLPGAGASSPILYGDHIYVTAYSGHFVPGEPEHNVEQLKRHLVALRRGSGDIIWDKRVPAKLPIEDGSRFDASPAVDGNRLLLRSEKFLYCISTAEIP